VEALRGEHGRRTSRLSSLREIQDRFEGLALGTRAVMQSADAIAARAARDRTAIHGVVADVVRAPEQLEVAVEAALGERLGGVVVSAPEVGLEAVRFLKEARQGRSAFVPVIDASDPPAGGGGSGGGESAARPEGVLGAMAELVTFAEGYEHMGRRLLGGTVVVDDLARALELHRAGERARLVTLEGDLVDGDGVVAGGSREAQGAGLLAQKREIRDLEETVARLESELAVAMAHLVTAKADHKHVVKALEGLRGQAHQGDLAIMGHEKDEARVRAELDRLRDRLGYLGTEQLELEERLGAIGAEEAGHRERRAAAELAVGDLERAQLDTLAEVSDHRDRLDELARVLTEAKIRAAQLGEKRAAAEAAALRLQRTDAELAERARRLAAEIDEAARRSAQLRHACDQLAAELAAVREEREEGARLLEQGRAAAAARGAALAEAELDARELRGRADRLTTEVGQLELRDGQIQMTRQVVADHVWDRYQLEVPKILHDYHLRPVISEPQEARLTELRDLIERMGTDINLTAIEEYAEVSQRFEFLSAQQVDLERAVDQLQRAIDKINRTSRKLFKDTFDAVNATFKEVFPRLFRGGQAALSLTGVPAAATSADAAEGGAGAAPAGKVIDLLEAGIEIMAQPPGKKNSTVEQLSGGEKALTAVALVFSIFLIKPSPFCILDAVDAPLDEANVDRYNELVREMTDRSQFIVITHNKRTMEAADTLYGVTMQEPGVSKLVAVNLSRLGRERPASAAVG
jgi:chromosome segregation protein